MKTSITFYPNKHKKNGKTGQVPLYMRVQLGKTKAETRLDANLTEQELPLWDDMTQRLRDRKHRLNGYLSTLEKKYEDFRIEYATKLSTSDPRVIRDYIIGKRLSKSPKVIEYIDHYYQASVDKNAQLSNGTKINYRKAIRHFKNFLSYKKISELTLENLNNMLALSFRDYLLNSIPELKKTGMTEPTALGNVKKFRTIFDRAVDEDLLAKNPFKKIKLKNQSPVRDRLDIQQVKQLYDIDFSLIPTQKLYRDIFLLSVFTGLAYKDLMGLAPSNLTETTHGHTKLTLSRTKTEVPTEMILSKYALDIIAVYKEHPEVIYSRSLLPKRSNKEVNLQLKLLAGIAVIPIKLTTHIGRHSFRQLLAEAGVSDTGVIKLMMGHSRKSDIDGIYHQVTIQSLISAKEKLEIYLSKYL